MPKASKSKLQPKFPSEGEVREADQTRRLAHKLVGGDMEENKAKNSEDIPDLDDYKKILARAEQIFRERNQVRKSAFWSAGWKGNLVECRKKLDRLWAIWKDDRSPDPKDVDEAIDLINAVVFAIICMEEGNADGYWDWP
ncbi:MAG TPA: hypothetical protein VM715_22050 [Candidatus Acidoferrum sp.]|nr:hypothetical protein [Candidatus Acidoferrum sp.]